MSEVNELTPELMNEALFNFSEAVALPLFLQQGFPNRLGEKELHGPLCDYFHAVFPFLELISKPKISANTSSAKCAGILDFLLDGKPVEFVVCKLITDSNNLTVGNNRREIAKLTQFDSDAYLFLLDFSKRPLLGPRNYQWEVYRDEINSIEKRPNKNKFHIIYVWYSEIDRELTKINFEF